MDGFLFLVGRRFADLLHKASCHGKMPLESDFFITNNLLEGEQSCKSKDSSVSIRNVCVFFV